jgi:hypothetical protein
MCSASLWRPILIFARTTFVGFVVVRVQVGLWLDWNPESRSRPPLGPRHTFAVDLLLGGGNPYDVAKMLSDSMETVEKHDMPCVRELRERVRRIMETGTSLEETWNCGVRTASRRPKETTPAGANLSSR